MEKTIIVESITLYISTQGTGIRVRSNGENVIFPNQNFETIIKLIEWNSKVVANHYKLMVARSKSDFDLIDISCISVSIVLYYLYMYNSWRNMYKNEADRDLRFNEKDFGNPSTHDILFDYFKKKYHATWEEKCSILLGMELSELRSYYKSREDFYNK